MCEANAGHEFTGRAILPVRAPSNPLAVAQAKCFYGTAMLARCAHQNAEDEQRETAAGQVVALAATVKRAMQQSAMSCQDEYGLLQLRCS